MQTPKSVGRDWIVLSNPYLGLWKQLPDTQLQGHALCSLTLVHVFWKDKKMAFSNFNNEKIWRK